MTLLELVEEVHEKTHAPQIEIFSIVRAAWPDGRDQFTETQCALVARALSGGGASPECISPLRRL